MFLVPKAMSTQHPDNATPAPFADEAGVLKGDGEVAEAVDVFALGCDEQMWDSEGKEADNQVVRKLLTNYPDFFSKDIQLGRDVALTLARAQPPHRAGHGKVHGGGAPERAIGLGYGQQLLRRRQLRGAHPGGHSPLHYHG